MLHEGLQQDPRRAPVPAGYPDAWFVERDGDEEILQGLGAAIEDCVPADAELSFTT